MGTKNHTQKFYDKKTCTGWHKPQLNLNWNEHEIDLHLRFNWRLCNPVLTQGFCGSLYCFVFFYSCAVSSFEFSACKIMLQYTKYLLFIDWLIDWCLTLFSFQSSVCDKIMSQLGQDRKKYSTIQRNFEEIPVYVSHRKKDISISQRWVIWLSLLLTALWYLSV
jgi:hypothetical protein